jgi:hypothetical protein
MGFKAITRNPKSVLVPRTNARQKAHVEAFERQTGKKKKSMVWPGRCFCQVFLMETKLYPVFTYFLELGTTCRMSQGFSKQGP